MSYMKGYRGKQVSDELEDFCRKLGEAFDKLDFSFVSMENKLS